jgi:mono/diheme cytochrome c family protein
LGSTVALAQDLPSTIAPASAVTAEELAVLRANSVPVDLVADFDNGSTIYDSACSACHGETGEGGRDDGTALRNTALSLNEIMRVVEDGRATMPAFDMLSDQQLLDVSMLVKDRL